ncbi:MAG TPA: DNA polymerase III subunit delta [Marinilabiliales bacterium]|jgi:DNA polymerase-3 subunit delta|nr:DNA polymerase III subunit delta [Marinilabiliales bacterium]
MHTFEQIVGDLKKKIYKPVYYLMGEESYFIDEITNLIEKGVLPEAERSFNQTILYGKDIDLGALLNHARRFPMMSNYNVVIVKEAQNMKDIEGMAADKTDPFLMYAENPSKSTILVINLKGKSLDKRKKLFKVLDKDQVLFESVKMYDNKVGTWIINQFKEAGKTIDPKAAELMASHLGNDLSLVAREIEKLLITAPKNSPVTLKEIEDNVGISKDFNVFELQHAIGKKDVYKANLIITHMGQNPKTKSIIPMIAFLYSYFTKIIMVHSADDKSKQSLASLLGVNPFFIQDYLDAARNYPKSKCIHIISFLREYDAKSKGIDSPPVEDLELMRELIYKILHI